MPNVKIITAISAAVIAACACVSMIVSSSSENDTIIIINDKSGISETSPTEQVTSSVTSVISTAPVTTTSVTSTSKTTAVQTTVRTTSAEPVSTDVLPVSCETEVSDCEGDEILYIDINNAEKEDFIRLKGIGEHLADEIISYRNQYGCFNNIEEIMNVSGIGEKIFADIADCIYVENPVYPVEEEFYEEIISDEPAYHEQEEIQPETQLTLDDCIPININTADKEILMLLPYVDESAADEIIQLRSQLGTYTNTYELLYLKSISQSQLAEIIEYLTV